MQEDTWLGLAWLGLALMACWLYFSPTHLPPPQDKYGQRRLCLKGGLQGWHQVRLQGGQKGFKDFKWKSFMSMSQELSRVA